MNLTKEQLSEMEKEAERWIANHTLRAIRGNNVVADGAYKTGFIAGITSPFVSKLIEQEKINAQIKILEEIREGMSLFEVNNSDVTITNIHVKLTELKKEKL